MTPQNNVNNSPLATGIVEFHRPEPTRPFTTPYPHGPFAWALASTTGSSSLTHTDAAGFATVVEVLLGCKLWMIGIGDTTPSPNWDDSFGRWQAIYLEPGQTL